MLPVDDLLFSPGECLTLEEEGTMLLDLENMDPLDSMEDLTASLEDATEGVRTPDSGVGKEIGILQLKPERGVEKDPFAEIRGLLAPVESHSPGLTTRIIEAIHRLQIPMATPKGAKILVEEC